MTKRRGAHTSYIELEAVEHIATVKGIEEFFLHTNAGAISARFHIPKQPSNAVVIWVGGAGGGLEGPAGGLFPRLATQLVEESIASLRLHYRYSGYLEDCIMDTLLCIEYLKSHDYTRIILVGHSFGGAVVISAGALSNEVVAVAPLSSQTYGTAQISNLSPRPILLMHGTADEILPHTCSQDLYARANEPKQLLLYPGCRHGLDECRESVDHDLLQWLRQVLVN
jgi:fermentation-respiration switch protein FrsA (DUF1100 family)